MCAPVGCITITYGPYNCTSCAGNRDQQNLYFHLHGDPLKKISAVSPRESLRIFLKMAFRLVFLIKVDQVNSMLKTYCMCIVVFICSENGFVTLMNHCDV